MKKEEIIIRLENIKKDHSIVRDGDAYRISATLLEAILEYLNYEKKSN